MGQDRVDTCIAAGSSLSTKPYRLWRGVHLIRSGSLDRPELGRGRLADRGLEHAEGPHGSASHRNGETVDENVVVAEHLKSGCSTS